MKARNDKQHEKLGVGLLVAHFLCCGLALLIIGVGGVGTGVVIGYLKNSLVPVGAGLGVLLCGWAGYRLWKKPPVKGDNHEIE